MSDFIQNLESGKEAMISKLYTKAIEHFQRAKEQNKKNIYVCRLLGNCLRIIGRVDSAIEAYKEGLSRGYHAGTHKRLLNALNYTEITQQYIAEEHNAWATRNLPESQEDHKFDKKNAGKKIRVGYVSPDFKSHPVAYFLLPIYRQHNKNLFEIVSFYNGSTKDGVTRQFESMSNSWHEVEKLTSNTLYEMIKEEKIDILIDLAGHTSGNRLDVFAKKPSPIQLTYLGYPNTTGLKTIDYRIVDSVTDPESTPSSWNSEILHRMSNCFLCFEPPKEKLDIENAPVFSNNYITFGTFNKISKITDNMIQIWVNILKMVPKSKMILKSVCFDNDEEKNRFKQRLLNAGIDDVSRVILYGLVSSRSQHMLMYNKMDIALDTYPYNGTTTTMQSLYMSVPVITLQGNSHISRVSSSILKNINLDCLVARTKEDYIKIAIELAQDVKKVVEYKKNIRKRMMASVLVDSVSFTKELEDFYVNLVENHT